MSERRRAGRRYVWWPDKRARMTRPQQDSPSGSSHLFLPILKFFLSILLFAYLARDDLIHPA
jgi:hypothetical protein